MWMMGKKVRGKSIQHPMGGKKYPAKLDDAELEQLTIKLREGDDSVRERICDGHVRLAISIASKYAIPGKTGDIVSAAFTGIAYALDCAKEKMTDNNITPWITVNIHRFIADFIRSDFPVPVPKTTIDRRIKEGRPIILRPFYSFNSDERGENADSVSKLQDSIFRMSHRQAREEANITAIMDLIDEIIDEEETAERRTLKRMVIQLRAAGYDDPEIATMLQISRPFVNKLRNEVEKEYDKRK